MVWEYCGGIVQKKPGNQTPQCPGRRGGRPRKRWRDELDVFLERSSAQS